jgi:hypothetical protein
MAPALAVLALGPFVDSQSARPPSLEEHGSKSLGKVLAAPEFHILRTDFPR